MIPKILVVDDNDSITLLLSLTLKTEGYDVEPAADGMESFQKFQLNEPEVLVTDLPCQKWTARSCVVEFARYPACQSS